MGRFAVDMGAVLMDERVAAGTKGQRYQVQPIIQVILQLGQEGRRFSIAAENKKWPSGIKTLIADVL